MISNNRGALTLDFIFALVLVTGLSGILLALSLTLVMVEASQYIAFSTSRVYFGGHLDIDSQNAAAEAKFANLKEQKAFKNLFSNGWFDLKDEKQRDYREEYNEPANSNTFVGVRLLFTATMLDFNIPFFGSTGGDGKGFKAKITSFLGREPTFQECTDFMQQRLDAIMRLPGASFNGLPVTDYVARTDNGC